jgi:hypothetical protein
MKSSESCRPCSDIDWQKRNAGWPTYDMDHSNPEQRAAFLEKVKRTFEAW